ncbi:hypothetical protein KHA80_07525 [Anaerobacillus sp. HL2]|nr:hypothetical protein KHA80_07525 [Anaerobacillus sp. HL2]
MGSYVEDVAQLTNSVTEEQAQKLGESTEKIIGKVVNISEKVNTSKLGGLVRFASEIAKKVPGGKNVFSEPK